MRVPRTCEVLRFEPQTDRARAVVSALASAGAQAGVDVRRTSVYTGGSDWLMVWGPGAPNRFDPMRRQLDAGGHVVALDLSYWQRDYKFRISIDAPHPQQWVLREQLPLDRFEADRVDIESAWNPSGPVIVAGIGEKATAQYGAVVVTWEASMIAAVRASGRRVLYRPKKFGAVPDGVERTVAGPIETVIRGASAVVTWHSNVAIDAIRLGIPVVCADGAAAAVCSSSWRDDLKPLRADWRETFLGNLAWFQWAPSEAVACWTFLQRLLL